MDAKYCRDRAETCLRLAKELSWNNPGRFQLMDIAEKFQRRATSLEAQEQRAPPQTTQPTDRPTQKRQPQTRRT
jgi:hypothetical protein